MKNKLKSVIFMQASLKSSPSHILNIVFPVYLTYIVHCIYQNLGVYSIYQFTVLSTLYMSVVGPYGEVAICCFTSSLCNISFSPRPMNEGGK